jgi:hypothetical protein
MIVVIIIAPFAFGGLLVAVQASFIWMVVLDAMNAKQVDGVMRDEQGYLGVRQRRFEIHLCIVGQKTPWAENA